MTWIHVVAGLLGLVVGIGSYFLTKRIGAAVLLAGIFIALSLMTVNKYMSPYYEAGKFKARIKENNPLLNLLAEKAPEEFQIYAEKVKHNILTKGDKNNEVYFLSELLYNAVIKFGPIATNASMYQFLEANLVLDKKLYSIDPSLVLAMEFPEKFKGKVDPNSLGVIADTQKLSDAKVAVITTAIEDPQTPLTEKQQQEGLAMIREIVDELSKKYGSETLSKALQQPDDPSMAPKEVAEIIIAFYEKILAKGEDNAGLIVKVMLLHSPLRK